MNDEMIKMQNKINLYEELLKEAIDQVWQWYGYSNEFTEKVEAALKSK